MRDDLVLELAHLVDDDTLAIRLENAYGSGIKLLALDIPERESIIRALEDPPAGFEELDAVLLQQHVGKNATGLPRSRRAQCARADARQSLLAAGTGKHVLEVAAVLLSGVEVEDRQVLQIAGLVDATLGSKLVTAYRLHFPVVALNIREREAILDALETAPALRDLRDALVANGAWQIRRGLPR